MSCGKNLIISIKRKRKKKKKCKEKLNTIGYGLKEVVIRDKTLSIAGESAS